MHLEICWNLDAACIDLFETFSDANYIFQCKKISISANFHKHLEGLL